MTAEDDLPDDAGTPGPAPGPAVLDASAVLAWLRGEPGADVVTGYLENAVICAVNFAEVHQKLAQHGVDAVAAARLRPVTRAAGLSLEDRCCLALAARLAGPAVTADSAWSTLDTGVGVVPIR